MGYRLHQPIWMICTGVLPQCRMSQGPSQQVFCRLQEAGLMLHGRKCSIGEAKVCYLGHIFSADGIQPDPNKVHAVQAWPTPTDVAALHQFLDLASYYR